MDLEADLKWIRQELENVKDPTFIDAIKNMLIYRKKVSLERISLEQYNSEIDASIAQTENEKTYTHKEMEERIKQWTKQ